MPSIQKIAQKLNSLSYKYKVGHLQELRKELKGFNRIPGSNIFSDQTIWEKDGYAFHHGGRKELQYNIGFVESEKMLRYGVAFSLESSKTLPDPSLLFPKILRFNIYVRENREALSPYFMQVWNEDLDETTKVVEIGQGLMNTESFIFIGKTIPVNNIDYDEILATFDDLLDLYIFVENETNQPVAPQADSDAEFKFSQKQRSMKRTTTYTSTEKKIDVDFRHTLIQVKLIKMLQKKFGEKNVSWENPFSGFKIDVVVKDGNDYIFYEVKVASSGRACIREAFGQLMEYAYWPGKRNAIKMVIVGEHHLSKQERSYLDYLTKTFKLPVDYLVVKADDN